MVQLEGENTLPSEGRVLVSLDGAPPREFPVEQGLRLGELTPEGEPIGEGAHVLLFAFSDQAGRIHRGPMGDHGGAFGVVHFSVGAARGANTPPTLFCLSPAGTYYGEPEGGLRLELVSLEEAQSPLRLRIEGRELDQVVEVDPRTPYLLRGLPVGDVRISELAREGAPSCIVTLNPERAP